MSESVPLLQDGLYRGAARLPDKIALWSRRGALTYGALARASNACAHALRARGVERGDRVVIFADNGPEVAIALHGALAAGAVASVVNPLTKVDKLAYILADCGASALVTDAHLAAVAAPAAARASALRTLLCSGDPSGTPLTSDPRLASWDEALSAHPGDAPPPSRTIDVDLAAIVYTSGSTGDPKGVMLTHRNMVAAASSISSYLELREDDVLLCALPLAFDYGLYQLLMALRVGARVVLERSFTFPAQVLDTVVEQRVTVFPGVPTTFTLLAGMDLGRWDLSGVRTVTNTAAALHRGHIDGIRRMFPRARLFSMYGLTECKRVSYLPPDLLDRKPDSVGIPIPNTEVWIEGGDGRRLPPGEVGELVVRGATVMRGYWGKPEETAKKLRPGPLPGEWVLHTGDLCRLDEEGFLYFVARTDDIIKSRGEKVAPKEVEAALVAIPGVVEAAVVGVPDPLLGQAVKAFVVLAAGVTMTGRELQQACGARLESFMVPKQVEIVPELPRTDTGKIRKAGLR